MITRRHLRHCAAAAVLVSLFATGCEQAKEAVNKGGDTPCSEFVKQDNDKQHVTVRKYLEQDNKSNAPDDQTVSRSVTAIQLMCKAQANPETPIRNADLTGILVPK
ncbi:hypothetical protein NDR87_02855 [Nocardia sp. CDC159]|uniref:Acid stress chaperone HdeA n=1 Tax=Nocardia pulmonis TaxID=2951408 RepID=A0A9X2E0Q5_9NOCA|nr:MULTISPECIES: hypothetical protein [Nocardia]MCM6772047.1 hypothetical protein [Nocardia pulmonis]MCM6785295.1 hypothetical protein [Nocardia sp. CDC159]